MKWITVAVALAVINTATCGHDIHKHFMAWMKKHYTPEEVKAFVRDDLTTGSIGGGLLTKGTNDRPVVFVHGLNNEAGNLWKVARVFAAHGFPTQYMFATTWGRGLEPTNFNVGMSCAHVRHIRRFIEMVLKYTGAKQIDVIGYSMGSPIARKAILGGKCVDDANVALGPSLQSRIHTYISVAGANQGSYLCGLPFFEICNANTGLSCNSKFLADINWFKNYESSYKSFNLASSGDSVVGYMACGKKASEFPGGHEWKVEGLNHEQTEFDTAEIQLKMLRESTDGKSKSRPAGKNSFAEVKKYLNTKRRDDRPPIPEKPVPKKAAAKKAAPKKAAPKKASPPKKAPTKKAAPAKRAAPKKAAPPKKNQKPASH
ncbi:hypothetical protein L5515_011492 [Caenorhabditis briggsae]|uniref:Uncharacterized protein n=1 Tax=Caenorhabditis briggsae TaxID=6238 RepID=A0AAE9EUE6_CAEBR|nr:hypothetical protein L5515_011492 [Caenorhabditis briggsae]